MMKTLKVTARYKGQPSKGLTPGQVYQLEIRNKGARRGEAQGPHDWVAVREANFGCPYTVRGFLLNWEVVSIV